MTASGAGGRTAAPDRRILRIAVGYAIAGAVVLGLGFWVAGRDPISPGAPEVWSLVIYNPESGAVVDHPLTLMIETRAPLELGAQGWVAGRLHPHVLVNGVELMPAAADIEALGDGRYRWRLPTVSRGTHQVQVVWSGPDHAQIPEGASAPITVEVR